MIRWLILGAGGQVGRRVMECLGPQAHGYTRHQLDILNSHAVAAALDAACPSVVVNCAAYTDVDGAQSRSDLAHAVNAKAPAALAELCRRASIPLIHLSTDYVFDGSADHPYAEDAAAAPVNVYAASKLAGERAVLESGVRCAVLRLAWVFDRIEDGFVGKVLQLGSRQSSLAMVADQFGCPTPARAIAGTIVQVGRILERGGGGDGLFHYCGGPAVNRLDWAREILNVGGLRHVDLVPVDSGHFPTPARRPLYTALDCSKIARVYGLSPPDWKAALRQAAAERGGAMKGIILAGRNGHPPASADQVAEQADSD